MHHNSTQISNNIPSLPTHYTIPPLRPNIIANMTIIDKFLLITDNSHHDFDDDSMATMSALGKFQIHKPAELFNVSIGSSRASLWRDSTKVEHPMWESVRREWNCRSRGSTGRRPWTSRRRRASGRRGAQWVCLLGEERRRRGVCKGGRRSVVSAIRPSPAACSAAAGL